MRSARFGVIPLKSGSDPFNNGEFASDFEVVFLLADLIHDNDLSSLGLQPPTNQSFNLS